MFLDKAESLKNHGYSKSHWALTLCKNFKIAESYLAVQGLFTEAYLSKTR